MTSPTSGGDITSAFATHALVSGVMVSVGGGARAEGRRGGSRTRFGLKVKVGVSKLSECSVEG